MNKDLQIKLKQMKLDAEANRRYRKKCIDNFMYNHQVKEKVVKFGVKALAITISTAIELKRMGV